MTAILFYFFGNYPVLIGDLLVSGNETENMLNIPSLGKIETIFPKGSGYVPVKLIQKVNIVNDNLAMAWSGSYIQAKTFFKSLSHKFEDIDVTRASIEEFIMKELPDYKHYKDFHFIIMGIEKKLPFSFSIWADEKKDSFLNKLVGSGSGIEDFFSEIDNSKKPYNEDTVESLDLPKQAVAFTLGLTSRLTQMELYFGSTISNYFGGGFEVAIINKGKITKLDDITYVFWNAKEETNGEISMGLPIKILKYKYFEKFLVIRSCNLIGNEITNQNIHIINPIDENFVLTNNNLPKPKFNSKIYIHQIKCRYKDNSSVSLSVTVLSSKAFGSMRINESKNKIWLEVEKEFITSVLTKLKDAKGQKLSKETEVF